MPSSPGEPHQVLGAGERTRAPRLGHRVEEAFLEIDDDERGGLGRKGRAAWDTGLVGRDRGSADVDVVALSMDWMQCADAGSRAARQPGQRERKRRRHSEARAGDTHGRVGEGWGGIVWNREHRVPPRRGRDHRRRTPTRCRRSRSLPSFRADAARSRRRARPTPRPSCCPPAVTTPPPPPPEPPPVAAATIEKVGWRLDEVLPPADRFTPNTPSKDVSQQRGVQVGTVVKMRREGGPPWYLASGTRNCDGGFVVLDSTGEPDLGRRAHPDVRHAARAQSVRPRRRRKRRARRVRRRQRVRVPDPPEHGEPRVERLGHWTCRP
jgi:hypothetical protein